MDKNTYVYCTNCKYGEDLINSLVNEAKEPKECSTCNPYDPEDSCPLSERPNYIEA